MTMIVLHPFHAFPIVDGQPDYDTAVTILRGELVAEQGRWLEGGVLFTPVQGFGTQYVTDLETFDYAVVP